MADPPTMDASVLIPSRGRAQALARCLRRLGGQTIRSGSFEVVVGLDGEPARDFGQAERIWRRGRDRQIRIIEYPKMGLIAVRRRLLEEAAGRIFISLNDDVAPEPGFVQAHLDAHLEARAVRGIEAAVIAGASPIPRFADETLFERLVRETDIVFFQRRQADSADRWRDWGYRNCFGLNFSAPTNALLAVGGFPDLRDAYGYEETEIVFRLRAAFAAPVLVRTEALAPHEHRFSPGDLIRREFLLGQSAWRFAQENPEFARDLFRRDIASAEEVEYARAFIARERRDAERLERAFCALGETPADALRDGPEARAALDALSQQWTTLKRLMWRWGLVEAAAGRLVSDARPAPASVAALGAAGEALGRGATRLRCAIEPRLARHAAAQDSAG